jgi:hypothetical protein
MAGIARRGLACSPGAAAMSVFLTLDTVRSVRMPTVVLFVIWPLVGW